MAATLRDVLLPDRQLSRHTDSVALDYLASLAERSLASVESEEAQTLAAEGHSVLLSLQEVSRQSHVAMTNSAVCHASLRRIVPALAANVSDLRVAVPRLEETAFGFSSSYSRSAAAASVSASASASTSNPTAEATAAEAATAPPPPPQPTAENAHLVGRGKALVLLRNVERLVDLMELPTLLSSTLSSTSANFASALDIYGHVQRIRSLYPESALVASVGREADVQIRRMAADLLVTLRSPTLKLAASLRLIGCLRRILSCLDVVPQGQEHDGVRDRTVALVFLLSRMSTLVNTLGALSPLRDRADVEKMASSSSLSQPWAGGQQTERYLKRYIELFREQSFGVLSMFRSIFVGDSTDAGSGGGSASASAAPRPPDHDGLRPLPSALATLPLCLADMLLGTLREYLPQVRDQGSRDSIMTQALYCAGSLGRLGGDFGVLLAGVATESEWVEVVKKHRLLAGRLETVIGAAREG